MAKIKLAPGPFIFPMPLVLIGAEQDGRANFMPAAFVGISSFKPPVVVCGIDTKHRTAQLLEKQGEFSINLPPPELAIVTDYCGLVSGHKVDKSGLFQTFTGELAHAPLIEGCRLAAECRLIRSVPQGGDTAYFAEIVAVHADEEVLVDGQPDWTKINPMLFTFPKPAYWRLGEYIAPAWQVGKTYQK